MSKPLHWFLAILILIAGIEIWQFSAKWMFLCEVQWVAVVFLLGLPILAWKQSRPLLLGAYEINTLWEGFSVALLLSLAATSVIWTAQLELTLAKYRLLNEPVGKYPVPFVVGGVLLAIGILLNLIVTHIVSSPPAEPSRPHCSWHSFDTGMTIGILVGIVCLGAGEWLIFLFKHNLGKELPIELAGLVAGVQRAIKCLPWQFSAGYIGDEGKLTVESGHLSAFVLVIAVIVVYFLLGRQKLPPISSFCLVTIATVWSLSGIAFFFQVFRIPTVLPVAAWLLLSSRHPRADHYYQIRPINNHINAGGNALFAQDDATEPILVVAAAGGGIQAAAWTARVLVELKKECDAVMAGVFERSLRAVSGVSGGSVGLVHFLAAQARGLADSTIAAEAAEASSLERVTHALAYEDLQRAFFPFSIKDIYSDRGKALEQAWIDNGSRNKTYWTELQTATLQSWRTLCTERKLPAVILNATIVEKGQRLAFSTHPLPNPIGANGFCEFTDLYPKYDIPIVTAARLSSAFTFVSPAARPQASGLEKALKQIFSGPSPEKGYENLHFVDGGYLDNSGIMALIQLLHQEVSKLPEHQSAEQRRKILILLINSFPLPEEQYVQPHRGTFFQLWAPLLTLFTVRSAAHDSAAQRELTLLKEALARWAEVDWIDFRFNAGAQKSARKGSRIVAKEPPPLSWHLTKIQKQAIGDAWKEMRTKSHQVIDFLKTGTLPTSRAGFYAPSVRLWRSLNPGETVKIEIDSRKLWNPTILIEPGVEYDFLVPDQQHWVDLCTSVDASGYDIKFLHNVPWARRNQEFNWFALVGSIDMNPSTEFLIGTQRIGYSSTRGGSLFCFANDAWFTYWNNWGSVMLTITRRAHLSS